MSHGQQRMWVLSQLDSTGSAYNIPAVLRVKGELREDLLAASLLTLTKRHEILNTTFGTVNDEPCQLIHPQCMVEIKNDYYSSEDEAALLIDKEIRIPFDLQSLPLFRVRILRSTDEEQRFLVITMHHIISDGWSIGVLMKELSALYNASLNHQDAKLPELDIQYGDYAVWQHEWMKSGEYTRQLNFWKKELEEIEPLNSIPPDLPRPKILEDEGAVFRFILGENMLKQLRLLASESRSTLFMVLLAAYQALIYRYSLREDVITGTPVANRDQKEIEPLVGFFANTLIVRSRIGPSQTFLQLLQQVRERMGMILSNQELPFEKLVDEIITQRDQSFPPLFQLFFALHNADHDAIVMEGLDVSVQNYHTGTSKFELSMLAVEKAGQLSIALEYNTALFKRSTIERFASHFQNLLAAIVKNPAGRIAEFDFLTAEELWRFSSAWRGDGIPLYNGRMLQERFEAQVLTTPRHTALQFGDAQLNYEELNKAANRLSWKLKRVGVTRDVPVAIMVPRSFEMIISVLAVIKAGGAYVPVDPNYPLRRKELILQTGNLHHIISYPDIIGEMQFEGTLIIPGDADEELETNPPHINSPGDLAYIIFTSGSTGVPKGVMVEQGNLSNLIQFYVEGTGIDFTSTLQFTTLSFDVAATEIFSPLITGGTLVLISDEQRKDPDQFFSIIEHHDISALSIATAYLKFLVDENQVEYLPRCVKNIVVAGEQLVIKKELRALLEERKIFLHNHYGPSETAPVSTVFKISPGESCAEIPPIGRPVFNTTVYVIDENDRLLPQGLPGELCIGGVQVGRGYWNDPVRTAESFRSDIFEGDRVYKTGDLVRWNEAGYLEFLGRKDDQVKIRGYRIQLKEIESLVRSFNGVNDAVAITKGEGAEKKIISYFTSAVAIAGEELLKYLAKHLPDYMIPAAAIRMEEFPLTPSGKVDRLKLPLPGNITVTSEAGFPVNELETQLQKLWDEILGYRGIGVNGNFFEAGGHSLGAVKLIHRINRTFHVKLGIRDIFSNPTIRGLAEQISSARKRTEEPISPAPAAEFYITSPVQRRIWLLSQFEGGKSTYTISGAYRITGLKAAHIETALQLVLERHESLRTVFPVHAGEPVQRIIPIDEFGFRMKCIGSESMPVSREILAELISHELSEEFDLHTGPLIKVAFFHLEKESAVAIAMHHIISDGWSVDNLAREVIAHCNKILKGESASYKPLKIQYKDYAYWQHTRLQAGKLEESRAYWHAQFRELPQLLELPLDFIRTPVRSFEGAEYRKQLLAGEDYLRFRHVSAKNNITLFSGLAAASCLLLYRYTGQTDLVIGTPVSGRTHEELTDLIGAFINTLALRFSVDNDSSISEFFIQVHEHIVKAQENQEYPFDLLVNELSLPRDLGHHPLFDVMIDLQEKPHHFGVSQEDTISIERIVQPVRTSKFDLTFSYRDDGASLHVVIEYSKDLFASATAIAMADHLQVLLHNISLCPADAPLHSISILSDEERKQILPSFNHNEISIINSKSIIGCWSEQAEKNGDNTAFIFEGEKYSYARWNEMSNRVANYLIEKCNVRTGDRIGVLLPRSPLMLVALAGILKSGSAYVPIDSSAPHERVSFIARDAGCKLVLAENNAAGDVMSVAVSNALAGSNSDPGIVVNENDLAYIIYTSGSTGAPKGVMVEHGSLLRRLAGFSRLYDLDMRYRVLQLTNYTFDVSLYEIFLPVMLGGTIIVPGNYQHQNFNEIWKLLAENNVTDLQSTPGYLEALIDAMPGSLKDIHLERICVGGETISRELIGKVNSALPGVMLNNHYGPTEITIDACALRNLTSWEYNNIGTPLPDTIVYIMNAKMQLQPVGVPGEICVGGSCVARGYINAPQLTKEKFITDPIHGSGRIYRTGDIGRWKPDGSIEFLGRKDEQVKIRGLRVEPGEITHKLKEHDSVRDAVVLAAGHGHEKKLVAFWKRRNDPAGGSLSGGDELKQYLSRSLPSYMIPSQFIAVEDFPLTRNQKINRQALLSMISERPESSGIYGIPLSVPEAKMADLWSTVLQKEHVGVDQDFFELGGHSLKAMQLVSAIAGTFGTQIGIRDVFMYPTARQMCRYILQDVTNGERGILRVPAMDHYPLSAVQESMWMSLQFDRTGLLYNISELFEIRGKINIEALQQALDMLVERHESLRTLIIQVEGKPRQQVSGTLKVPLHLRIEGNRQDSPEAFYKELSAESSVPFDLAKGPLFRLTLYNIGEDRFALQMVSHHLISDEVSGMVFVHDLVSNYLSATGKSSNKLVPLRIQYKDYSAWHNDKTANGISRGFWQDILKGPLPLLNIPTDFPRTGIKSFASESVQFEIEQDSYAKLKQIAKERKATPFMMAAAAYSLALSRLSGQSDVIIGTPFSGRSSIELQNQVGNFANVIPLRIRIDAEEAFSDHIARVGKGIINAFMHGDFPVNTLLPDLEYDKSPMVHPLFSAGFTWHQPVDWQLLSNKLGDIKVGLFALPMANHFIPLGDFWLHLKEQDDSLKCDLLYRTDLFTRKTMVFLAEEIKNCFLAVANTPDISVARLSINVPPENGKKNLAFKFNF